ncbi:hypothetical protein AVEN_251667-1 [Araneus ventricosus]|uniref:FZ domain-containing protein n=1 Tax=Araneus ventricosus TaxID=182803 RepID=A0A4Y2HFI2_ARAVE|nr:hypothetical protein AVEN_251667-1 [Araneus ventricosus]
MKHFILFLGVLYAVCVFWSYGYSNEEFLKQWNCISESGDEDLCKEFQDCITLVPQCYLLPYSYCMRKILPNGAGDCSKTEQAYGSEKQRLEVDECYSDITTLPNGDDWTSFPEFAPFLVFILSIFSYMLINCKYFITLSEYIIKWSK